MKKQDEQDMQDARDLFVFYLKIHAFNFNHPAYPVHPDILMIWRELLEIQ